MKKILSTVLIASAFLFACNNADQSGTATESTTNPEMQIPATQSTLVSPDSAIDIPATDHSLTTSPSAPATAPATQKTTTATGMNPPHGEPGHRCDIAVGAPLNSAPATPTPTPTPVTPNIVTSPSGPATGTPQMQMMPAPTPPPTTTATTPAPPTTTTTAPGMNPPHGQPGHDCAVPVGSPLPVKK
jgi:hypothetical protein